MTTLKTYEQAVEFVNHMGFLPLSRNSCGYISLADMTSPSQWHTNLSCDPWIWKDKMAFENKAAYAKIFSKRPMFVSLKWYPVFLSYFRPSDSMEGLHKKGVISFYAYQIYKLLNEFGKLNTHNLRNMLHIKREEKSKFRNALIELQIKMFITVCGVSQKENKEGLPYGWHVTDYDLVERWCSREICHQSLEFSAREAGKMIKDHIRKNKPDMDEKEIEKFIGIYR